MKKITLVLTLIIITLLITTGCGNREKNGNHPDRAEAVYEPDKHTNILQSIEENVIGDSHKEHIVLYQQCDDQGMPISFVLTVNDVKNVSLNNERGLYTLAKVEFQDLDGDQINEMLFYRFSTGSSGARGLDIYKPDEGDWRRILAVNNPMGNGKDRFEITYLGNYVVSFMDKQTGLKSDIQLDKERYEGIEYMLEGISTWIDPISEYRMDETDSNGILEITAVQRAIGVSHPDVIALLKTTYRLHNGSYLARILTLTDEHGKVLDRVEL